MKLNQKRKGRMVLPMLENKNLEENLRENDKKNRIEPRLVEEREKVPFEKF